MTHAVRPFAYSSVLTFFLVCHYPQFLEALAAHIDHPQLPELARRFLFDQTNKNPEVTSDDVDFDNCPMIEGKISGFHSAVASFLPPQSQMRSLWDASETYPILPTVARESTPPRLCLCG